MAATQNTRPANLPAAPAGPVPAAAKRPTRKPKATPAKAKTPAKAATPEPAAKPAPANCLCGCGAPTVTAKAKFLSGHDARFAGQYGRGEIAANEAQIAYLQASPAMRAKVDRVIATAAKKAAAKAAREAAKQAAKEAYEAAMATV